MWPVEKDLNVTKNHIKSVIRGENVEQEEKNWNEMRNETEKTQQVKMMERCKRMEKTKQKENKKMERVIKPEKRWNRKLCKLRWKWWKRYNRFNWQKMYIKRVTNELNKNKMNTIE